jgi:glycosyltransferase involved in cell wall biosynthesis
MNLLLLCKRFPQGRDLLTRPYGRFYHLARTLVQRGHRVRIATLSYRRLPVVETSFDGIDWSSDDLWPTGPRAYLRRLNGIVTDFKPDWIIGASDTYFGIAACWLGKKRAVRFAIDAYDDFESYIPWALPLHAAWRTALARADLVTAAGPQLASTMEVRTGRQVEILPMAADPEFVELDRALCRSKLGLPSAARLIGHIGAFDRTRGAQVVLDALAQVQRSDPGVALVLSGRQSLTHHQPPNIYGTGYVPDELMPALVNSLDVACVALADNAFGRASYPAKLCEAMACRVPVVASSTGPTRWMLRNSDRFLAEIGNAEAMAAKLLVNLSLDRVDFGTPPSWGDIGARLESMLAVEGS